MSHPEKLKMNKLENGFATKLNGSVNKNHFEKQEINDKIADLVTEAFDDVMKIDAQILNPNQINEKYFKCL